MFFTNPWFKSKRLKERCFWHKVTTRWSQVGVGTRHFFFFLFWLNYNFCFDFEIFHFLGLVKSCDDWNDEAGVLELFDRPSQIWFLTLVSVEDEDAAEASASNCPPPTPRWCSNTGADADPCHSTWGGDGPTGSYLQSSHALPAPQRPFRPSVGPLLQSRAESAPWRHLRPGASM